MKFLARLGHVFRDHDAGALRGFEHFLNAGTSFVQGRNNRSAAFPESVDGGASFPYSVRHSGEFSGQINENRFGGSNVAGGILHGDAEAGVDV